MKRGNRQPGPKSGGVDREIMTVRDAADYLHCVPQTIYRLLTKGAIPAFRIGSDWRFRRSDIDKWIEDQTVVAPGPASTLVRRQMITEPAKRPRKTKSRS